MLTLQKKGKEFHQQKFLQQSNAKGALVQTGEK